MSKNAVNLLKWAAVLIISAGIYLIPVNDVFTLEMRNFLVATLFSLLLAAFEIFPVMLVGLLLPAAYVILKVVPVNVALGIWSSSFMIFMIVGGMIFANALDESGILRRIVLWAGTKCKGSLLKLLMALMVAGLIVMFISFANGWLVTLVLCYGVVKALGLEHSKEGILIMIVGQIVSTAALNFTYNPAAIALWGGGAAQADPTFQMQWWMQPVYDLPYIVIQFIVIFAFFKIYKPDPVLKGGEAYFVEEYAKLGKLTVKEIKAIVIACILFIFVFTQPIHHLDVNLAFILIPMLFFLPGIDVATPEKSLNTISISFIIFIASCMGIGGVGAAVGIGPAISTYVSPMLAGFPKPVFLFLCVIFGIIMNILMTPAAMQGMFPYPLAALAVGMGIKSPLIPFMAMFMANDMVFFPYENAYLLVLFGFGVMTMQDFMKYNVIKMAIELVLFCVLVIPWWFILGLI